MLYGTELVFVGVRLWLAALTPGANRQRFYRSSCGTSGVPSGQARLFAVINCKACSYACRSASPRYDPLRYPPGASLGSSLSALRNTSAGSSPSTFLGTSLSTPVGSSRSTFLGALLSTSVESALSTSDGTFPDTLAGSALSTFLGATLSSSVDASANHPLGSSLEPFPVSSIGSSLSTSVRDRSD
jgi:hypothetical protein